MTTPYCLPLQLRRTEDVETALVRHQGDFAYFEIWLSCLDDFRDEWAWELAEHWGKRLIFLLRRPQLAPLSWPRSRQRRLLEGLYERRAFVDFDLFTQRQMAEYWRALGGASQALLSVHDYEKTPEDAVLWEILDEMASWRPWICKLATMCRTRADALRILALCDTFPKRYPGQPFLFLGMGPHAAPTRIFGPLWGNALTFAPVELEAASAPGQLTRTQYQTLFALLGRAEGEG